MWARVCLCRRRLCLQEDLSSSSPNEKLLQPCSTFSSPHVHKEGFWKGLGAMSFGIRLRIIETKLLPVTQRLDAVSHPPPAMISPPCCRLCSLPSSHTGLLAVPQTHQTWLLPQGLCTLAVLLPEAVFPRTAAWGAALPPAVCTNVPSGRPVLIIPFEVTTSPVFPTLPHPAWFVPMEYVPELSEVCVSLHCRCRLLSLLLRLQCFVRPESRCPTGDTRNRTLMDFGEVSCQ